MVPVLSKVQNIFNYVAEKTTTEPPEEKTEPPPLENHTFVALLE